MRADLNSQLGAEDLNIWHYSSSNTLFEHAVLTRRLFTIDQTLLLQTACLTKNSNMAFPNSMFALLSNKINGPILSAHCLGRDWWRHNRTWAVRGVLRPARRWANGVGCNMRMLQLRVAPSELGLRDYNWTQTMWPSPHNAINCSANCTNSRSAITQPKTS